MQLHTQPQGAPRAQEGGSAPHTHHWVTPLPLAGCLQQRGEGTVITGQAGVPLGGQGGDTAQARAKQAGGMQGWTLTFSPFIPWMPGSPWEGNTGAGPGAASRGWMVLSIPLLRLDEPPLGPMSPTLSPLGPAGPGLSWGGGNEEGA